MNIGYYMSFLKYPIVFSIFIGLLAVIVLFIDNNVNNTGRDNKDYLKLFVYTIGLVMGSNWYLNRKTKQKGGGEKEEEEVYYDNPKW